MIRSEIQLTLSIARDAKTTGPYTVQLSAEGALLAATLQVEENQYHAVHHLADGCRQLIKEGGNPSLSEETLISIGTELFDLWLAPFWPHIQGHLNAHPGQPVHFTLTSNTSDPLFLPWELLRFPDSTLLGLNTRFGLRRLPQGSQHPVRCCPTLPPGPLRVLFMAASPSNAGSIDFDAEEAALRRCLEPIGPGREIFLEVVDSGRLETLKAHIHAFQPHLLHLVGPALITKEVGYFGFEDEIGNADIRSATELADVLLKHSGIQAVILSGREERHPSPVAALGAVARDLAENGTPMALSWGESLTHPLAGLFAHALYAALAAGQSMDGALHKARQAILEACRISGYPGWTLPMLFASTNQGRLFNSSPEAPRIRPVPLDRLLPPLAGLALGAVKHYRFQRRPIQHLLPHLSDGNLQAVLITGPEGCGKSTLASCLGNQLHTAGFTPIALTGTARIPVTTARIIAAFEQKLSEANLHDERDILINPRIGLEDRLGFLAALMNRRLPIVLILDGLEHSLNPENHRFIDPVMTPFFFYMLDQLNGRSRFIATSRVEPVSGGPAPLPATCREESLPERLSFLPVEPVTLDTKSLDRWQKIVVFNLPITTEGAARLMGETPDITENQWETWQRSGLVHRNTSKNDATWIIHRPVPDTLPWPQGETARNSHQTAGDYLLDRLHALDIESFQRPWLDVAQEALDHLLSAEAFGKGLQLLESINRFLGQLGLFWEMERLSRQFFVRHQHPLPLYHIAVAQQNQDDEQAARTTLTSLLAMTQGQQTREEALALFDLATLDTRQGRIRAAWQRWHAALEINRARDDHQGIVSCLTQIGMISIQSGKGQEAMAPLEEALERQRQKGTPPEIAQLLPWVADLHFRHGDPTLARAQFMETLSILQSFPSKIVESQTLHQLATLDLNEGLPIESLKGFRRSLAIKRELEDLKGEAATFFQLGRLAKEVDNQESCLRFLGLCCRIDQEIGSPDAEEEYKMFSDIAQAVGLSEEVAQSILNEVWEEYQDDKGESLISRTFDALKKPGKIIPIKPV